MKKKIFCIIVTVLLLVATFTLSIGATSQKEYYEWSYSWKDCGDTADTVGQGETVIPYHFYDTFSTESGDTAKRSYLLGYSTGFLQPQGLYEQGVIYSAFETLNGSEMAKYSRDGYVNYAYRFTLDDEYYQGVKGYDAHTQFEYTSYVVSHHFKYDYSNTPNYDIKQVTTQKPTEDGTNQTIFGYTFHRNGRVECITTVTFYDADNMAYKTITETTYIVVERYSSIEQDHYNHGYDVGYADGYNKGVADIVEGKEDYTIKGMINALAEAPFRFIDNAFGFEVFGINVASALRVLFTLAVVVLVVGLVVKFII